MTRIASATTRKTQPPSTPQSDEPPLDDYDLEVMVGVFIGAIVKKENVLPQEAIAYLLSVPADPGYYEGRIAFLRHAVKDPEEVEGCLRLGRYFLYQTRRILGSDATEDEINAKQTEGVTWINKALSRAKKNPSLNSERYEYWAFTILSDCYLEGRGVAVDLKESLDYLLLASYIRGEPSFSILKRMEVLARRFWTDQLDEKVYIYLDTYAERLLENPGITEDQRLIVGCTRERTPFMVNLKISGNTLTLDPPGPDLAPDFALAL